MLRDDTKKWVTALLLEELKRVRLGGWTSGWALARKCRGIEETDEDDYVVIEHDAHFSREDLETIWYEVSARAEEDGFVLDSSGGDGAFVYKCLPKGDYFDYNKLSKMEYRPFTYMDPTSDVGFSLEDNILYENRFGRESARVAELPNEACEKLYETLSSARIETWDKEYLAPVLDGTSWTFLMVFDDGTAFASSGSNAWPDSFDTLIDEVEKLLNEYGNPGDDYENEMSSDAIELAQKALEALAKMPDGTHINGNQAIGLVGDVNTIEHMDSIYIPLYIDRHAPEYGFICDDDPANAGACKGLPGVYPFFIRHIQRKEAE